MKRLPMGPLLIAVLADLAGGGAVSAQVDITLRRAASFGVEDGHSILAFGNVESLAVDSGSGTLFLVDRLNHRLIALNGDGDVVAVTGREGSGPGEFRYAARVALGASGVYLLDRGNLRIGVYELASGRFELMKEFPVPFQAHDMCVINDRVFLLAYHDGKIVHEFDPARGTVTHSFGSAFREDDPVVAALTSFGILACDEPGSSIYIAGVSVPTVRRYTLDGSLVWESVVPKKSSVITRTAQGVHYGPPAGGGVSQMTVSILPAPDGRLLVQFGETPHRSGVVQDIIVVSTAAYHVASGRLTGVSTSLPRIDLAASGHAWSVGNDPFPRVTRYQWR